jgi:hypothetical protein
LTVARLRASGIIASASVLALVLGGLGLATVSVAEGDGGDGVSDPQPPAPAGEGTRPAPKQVPIEALDEARAKLASQSLELGEQGARLSVSQAALRDQTLRADILTCLVVALLGATLAMTVRLRRPGADPGDGAPAERAKGPRRPSFD